MIKAITTMSTQKKYILVSVIALVVLLAVTIIPAALNNNANEEPNPSPQSPPSSTPNATVAIQGFAEQAENISDDRIKSIEENLFGTIALNSANPNPADAVIREGSYQQTVADAAKQIFHTTFIVDITSLKQSYRISDLFSPLPPEVTGLYDQTTFVRCLDTHELIYGEFDCQTLGMGI
ncbi:MAG: hypothetical protein FWD27_04595 [Coriobacteriia bacterium]|nr:hypothetical protein [Coriobacteriia bacterium]